MPKLLSKLPSIVWVIVIPLGLIAFIGGIILLFNVMARVEGVVSIIFLIVGFLFVKGSASMLPIKEENKVGSFATALGIVFFALMGMAVDQPGNYIYNKPIEWVYCKEDSHLSRSVNVSHPLPERTDITQYYTCVDDQGNEKFEVNLLGVLGIRFVEYVIIGYGLIGLAELLKKMKASRSVVQ